MLLNQCSELLSKIFQTLTRFLASFEMTGFAVMSILEHFDWDRIGLITENAPDPIWLLARQGVQQAAEKSNVTLAMSTLLMEDMDLEERLLKTASVSRGKPPPPLLRQTSKRPASAEVNHRRRS